MDLPPFQAKKNERGTLVVGVMQKGVSSSYARSHLPVRDMNLAQVIEDIGRHGWPPLHRGFQPRSACH